MDLRVARAVGLREIPSPSFRSHGARADFSLSPRRRE